MNERTFGRIAKPIMSLTCLIGTFAQRKKKRKKPEMFWTVRALLEVANIEIASLSTDIQEILDKKVLQICRAGSRFTKQSICVQLYNDGPKVLKWAMRHGALLLITKEQIEDFPCVVVNEPVKVYADMCAALYQTTAVNSTAVIGSIGKTTAKKMVYSVYSEAYNTFWEPGNDNQVDGIGYSAQHIPKRTEKWLQEVSEDTPGCTEQVSKIIKPNIAIITAIDKSHIEQFGNEQGILDEIASITKYMPDYGVCITSMDDENTKELIKNHRVVFVSMRNREADFYADSISVNTEGICFSITDKKNDRTCKMKLKNVFAVHNVYSALYAFAAGVIQGMCYEDIVHGIERYKSTGVRQNVFRAKGIVVYADCYNAVAKSVRSAINAAAEIPIKGKRIAVLGDIAETGEYTKSTHDELVDIVNSSNFDVLLALGENICKSIEAKNNRDDLEIVLCKSHKQLSKTLKRTMKKGDLVLFKASHSSRLDKCLSSVFRFAYTRKMLEYYWPQVAWRLKVIFS